jgi:hypothetical protein
VVVVVMDSVVVVAHLWRFVLMVVGSVMAVGSVVVSSHSWCSMMVVVLGSAAVAATVKNASTHWVDRRLMKFRQPARTTLSMLRH